MTTRQPLLLRSALALLSVRFVLQQIALGLIVFLLYVAWLRIPDASALDVIGTIVLALILLAVAGGGETWLLLRLCARIVTPKRLLRGALLLLAGIALWLAWCALLDHLHGDDTLRAGYLNSRFPHSMRNVFSYPHILLWFRWLWTTLEWIGAGIIAIFVFALAASIRPLPAIARASRSATYWIALLVGVTLATVITTSLVDWTPGHTLHAELTSLILRLILVILIDATIACFLLCILAAIIRRSDALYATPAGTPLESHPRTADAP